jgi:hypothetical protein
MNLKKLLIAAVVTFVTAVLGAMMAYGAHVIDLPASDWKAVAAAGVAAVLVFVYSVVVKLKATSLATDLILVFAVTALGQMVAFGAHIFDVGAGQWKGVLASAAAAAIAAAFNWLNSRFTDYGVPVR